MDLRPLVALAGIAAAAWMQGPAGEHNAERRRNDFRWSPDPRLVRVTAGAHRSTAADLLWLRTLPDMSKEFSDAAQKTRWIDSTFAAVTDLEPSFMRVYQFGQAYLTHLDRRAKGAADRAIALLEKGIRANPEDAGLRVYLAMIWYMEKKDRAKTIEILKEAASLDNFDNLSASMLTSLLAKERDDVYALGYWADLMEQQNEELRALAEMNLWDTKQKIASRAVREFAEKQGRQPAKPDDILVPSLVQAGAIPVLREGLEIDGTGRARYPQLAEFVLRDVCRQAGYWARAFRDEQSRWPTLEDLKSTDWGLPTPPAGRAWRFDDGKLSLVPAGDADGGGGGAK